MRLFQELHHRLGQGLRIPRRHQKAVRTRARPW
jgi:hypothetical protein